MHPLVERGVDRVGEQRPRGGVAEPVRAQLRQAGERLGVAGAGCGIAPGEDQRQVLGLDAARDEGKGLRA